ncbi:MAG: ABC transporter permease subunit [Actinophytocola sp.]|uniref:ABC transporter permease subunit n=1 Tax=Actinophytocola sp. TaxID=1872138 RepID=UPI00132798E3|nr:ABC transporter permease subunit [Actinophytocola sp.]MPZ85452.1 ABC transporter permease subunit [Actinophytocola sp.]
MTPYRSPLPGGDGFGRLLLAEWTKLRSVPRWVLTMISVVLLTVLVALLAAATSGSVEVAGEGGGGRSGPPPPYADQGHFVHRTLSGDGSLVARVASQENSHESAKAGLMIRSSVDPGAPYAAVLVTPDHGVVLQSDGDDDIAGSSGHAPRWLRLDRSGTTVTGYESADGEDWSRIGAVRLDELTGHAEVGLLVASPNKAKVTRQFGGESIDESPTIGEATFDSVRADPAQDGPWRDRDRSIVPEDSTFTEIGGTITLSGSGDLGPHEEYGDDVTRMTLTGALVGLMAVVALAVLFITAEYKRGMILATFAASPRRERVLAAKAVVLAGVTFVLGLVASFGAVLIASPILESHGMHPLALSDGRALRAVVGTAALLAVIAVFSLGVATLLRRSAAAITVVLLLLLVPQIVATGLPLSVATWLERLTPAAGFAIQQTVTRYDTAIGPWTGFAVLCAYTVAVLAVAGVRLRRRDA